MSDAQPPLSQREQTDESLRLERDSTDHALEDALAEADEAADALVVRARARADDVLALARRTADRDRESTPLPLAIDRARSAEDALIAVERVAADEVVRLQREEHTTGLSQERAATDHDLSDERVRADHAVATRDEFMGIVSHDLLNLLNAVVGTAAMIEKDASQVDHAQRVQAHARRIQRAGSRMQRLVGDLVDVASIEAGMMTTVRQVGDPTPVVIEAVQTFEAHAMGHGVSIVTEIVQPLPALAFDAARILQVLSNLLSNAIKFTPAPGTVVVRAEHIAGDIQCSVSDTGAGVPVDKLEAVFGRFVQLTPSDRRGVGLGLYISKCIVEGHGGRIWAESGVGNGSTFIFTLPVQSTR